MNGESGPPADAEQKMLLDLLNTFAENLGEHCEAVRIFVTKGSDDGSGNTIHLTTGRGNMLAQHGQVREWIIMQEEYVREKARIDQRRELGLE